MTILGITLALLCGLTLSAYIRALGVIFYLEGDYVEGLVFSTIGRHGEWLFGEWLVILWVMFLLATAVGS